MKDKLFTRNFTFLSLGQVSSLIGNYTLKFALSMYVLEQTGSASIFATLLAVAMLPTILLSPFGGILADRANRRNIMVWSMPRNVAVCCWERCLSKAAITHYTAISPIWLLKRCGPGCGSIERRLLNETRQWMQTIWCLSGSWRNSGWRRLASLCSGLQFWLHVSPPCPGYA